MFWDNNTGNDRIVLIIPNYTFSVDLEKDSFVDVIHSHIRAIKGVSWILPIPKGKGISKLNLPNVRQVEINMSGNMIWMRSNLPLDMIKLLKDEKYDVVYSHLPDWHIGRFTKQPIIGYAHWFEMPECNGVSWLNHSLNFPHEVINLLDYDVCFVNTKEQRDMILSNGYTYFNSDVVRKLEGIIKVMNLGVDESKIVSEPNTDYEKIIVFNHRTETYKGWGKFVEWMKKYRETRQDFIVWAPLLDKPNSESWIRTNKVGKDEYYKMLSKCCVCVQPKQLHAGWSVSATDCMMNGTPVLFGNQNCYYEIDNTADTFDDYKELKKKLDLYLDDRNYRMGRAEMVLKSVKRLVNNSENNIKTLTEYLVNPK